jgi:RHS repeat-associated protein
VFDTTGSVGERYAYSAYGAPVFMTGAGVVQSSSPIGFETLYAGYRWDNPAPQMYYVRNRFLLPQVGTWNRRDPLGYADGMGLIAYAVSSPITNTDTNGTSTQEHHWFARLGVTNRKGYKTALRLCKEKGIDFDIDDYTTPLKFGKGPPITPHYYLHYQMKPNHQDRCELVYDSAKTCCGLMKGLMAVMATAWAELVLKNLVSPGVPELYRWGSNNKTNNWRKLLFTLRKACAKDMTEKPPQFDCVENLHICQYEATMAYNQCVIDGAGYCGLKYAVDEFLCSQTFQACDVSRNACDLKKAMIENPGTTVFVIGGVLLITAAPEVLPAIEPVLGPLLPARTLLPL